MKAAKEVLDLETATQDDVDQVLQTLRDAIAQLKDAGSQEDMKEALRLLYEANITREEGKYTPESWNVFAEAMDEAKRVLDDPQAVQEQVDQAKDALQSAIDGLIIKEPVPEVNKTALKNLYDANTGKDQSKYTPDSWTAFTNAMNQAEAVLNDNEATQEQVDAAYGELEKAAAGLTQIPAPVVKVTGVKLAQKSAVLSAKGASIKLKATVLPENASDKSVTWKSKDKKIATVDATGKVTAVGNGSTRITVTTKDGKKTAECTVKVQIVKKPAKVTGTKVSKTTKTTLTLSWNKIKGADSYKVYVYKSNKKWKDFETTKKTSITLKGLSAGTKYTVKVVAVNKGGRGAYSTGASAATRPSAARLGTIKKYGSGSIKLSYSKVNGARYDIYMKTGKGDYRKVTTSSKTNAVVKGLKKGKTYRFKVRTFIRTKGKNYYGSDSNVKKYKVK